MSSYYTSVEDGGRSRNGDRCSNRSAYIMRSWVKSVERGVFLKNTLTSKKWVVASVTSTEQCQWGKWVCSRVVQVMRLLELAAQWLEQHLGCSNILKELLRCLKLWFYRAVGKETGCIQELMCFGSHISSSVTAEGPAQRGNLGDTLGLSFSIHFACSVGLRWGLGRWSWKGSKIRNTSHQSMKTTYSFSARISQGMHLCKNLTPISWFWIVVELETK